MSTNIARGGWPSVYKLLMYSYPFIRITNTRTGLGGRHEQAVTGYVQRRRGAGGDGDDEGGNGVLVVAISPPDTPPLAKHLIWLPKTGLQHRLLHNGMGGRGGVFHSPSVPAKGQGANDNFFCHSFFSRSPLLNLQPGATKSFRRLFASPHKINSTLVCLVISWLIFHAFEPKQADNILQVIVSGQTGNPFST